MYNKGIFILSIISLIFTYSLLVSHGSVDEKFELKVLGYAKESLGFIPGPCPPGIHCTYDSRGYNTIYLELIYHGDSPISIKTITMWQTLHRMGIKWNRSTWEPIIPPNVSLNQGDSYYFYSIGIYAFVDVGETYFEGPIYAKIETTNNLIHWVVVDVPVSIQAFTDTHYLANTHLFTTAKQSTWVSLLVLFIGIGVYVIKRKGK